MKRIGLLTLFALSFVFVQAQGGSAFGLKGGLTIGTQEWNNIDQGALFTWHGDVYVESLVEDNSFALIAQLGYHTRGSARRNQRIFTQNSNSSTINQSFEFNNISLMFGAKQKYDFQQNGKVYYMFGLRGEYTVSDNLEQYQDINPLFYPFPDGVRKLNMGLTIGGGFEMMFSQLFGGFLEFSVAPDITAQYKQQEIPNVTNPFTGNPQTIGERTIRNLSFEVSVGIRLLRIVEYID
ncbi:MAG: hypothetical protein ACI9XO_003082 [Paraglaciecola sp.]|jgi:hypothetical protein